MVNHGPSRGCAVCRARRVKCDMEQPSCRNCLARAVACPGARVSTEPIFRNTFSGTNEDVSSKQPAVDSKAETIISVSLVTEGIDTDLEPVVNTTEDELQSSFDVQSQNVDVARSMILHYFESNCVESTTHNLSTGNSIDTCNSLSTAIFVPGKDDSCNYDSLPSIENNCSDTLEQEGEVHEHFISRYSVLGQKLIGHKTSNPFDAAAIKKGVQQHSYLLEWSHCYLYMLSPTLHDTKSRHKEEKGWIEDCRRYLSGSIHLQYLVSGVLGMIDHQANQRSQREKVFAQSLLHQQESLQLLQSYIETGVIDSKLITGVWSAVVIAFSLGDLQSCVVHLQGLKRILDEADGFTSLSWDEATRILLWDLLASNMLLQRPVFSFKNWLGLIRKQSFTTDSDLRRQIEDITQSLDMSLLDVSLYLQTESHLRNHRAVMQLAELADTIHPVDPDAAYYLDRVVQAYRGAVAAADLSVYNDILASKPALQDKRRLELLKILAVSYCHKIVALQDPKQIRLYVSTQHLQNHILSVQQAGALFSRRSDLVTIMYACFIGSCIEQIPSDTLGDLTSMNPATIGCWHTKQFLEVAAKLQMESVEALRVVFQKLLYVRQTLDIYLRTALNCKGHL